MGPINARAGFHICPRFRCDAEVPDARYACPQYWAELSPETKRKITRTARPARSRLVHPTGLRRVA